MVPILNFSSHGHESLLYICGILGTCFHEGDSDFISKGLYKNTIDEHLYSKSQDRKIYNQLTFRFTLAVSQDTTLLAVRSHLFPTRSLFTFSLAYRSISFNHCLTLLKLSWSVTSQTTCQKANMKLMSVHEEETQAERTRRKSILTMMPCAPRQQLLVIVLKRSWPAVSHCHCPNKRRKQNQELQPQRAGDAQFLFIKLLVNMIHNKILR